MIRVTKNLTLVDQVLHKPGRTATENGQRLEFRIKEEEGLCYLYSENVGADHMRGYAFVFAYENQIF